MRIDREIGVVVDSAEVVRTTGAPQKLGDEFRIECLERFMKAVREGRKRNYGPAKSLVESVRKRFGDSAAAICRRELWAYIASDKKA